jgi:CheY-like chemotaxis protein
MGGKVVLAVSPDPGIRELLQMVLESALGVRAALAADADEALRLVHRTRPDLVLLDVRPPELGSLEVARRLKSDPATRSIKVVALIFWEEGRQEALEAGSDALLDKPFDNVDRFIDRVQKYLNNAA